MKILITEILLQRKAFRIYHRSIAARRAMSPSSKGSRLYRTCLNFSLFQLNPLIINDHSRNGKRSFSNRFDVSHRGTRIAALD